MKRFFFRKCTLVSLKTKGLNLNYATLHLTTSLIQEPTSLLVNEEDVFANRPKLFSSF
jgi:hypothetical protein